MMKIKLISLCLVAVLISVIYTGCQQPYIQDNKNNTEDIYSLKGIAFDTYHPELSVAFIKDKSEKDTVYRKGDSIGNYKISDIQRRKVVLVDNNGNQKVLQLSSIPSEKQ